MTWFEELGFISNPFTIKPQESFEDFFGHKEVIENLLEKVDDGVIVIVKGKYGTGKTSISKAIIDEFGGKRKVAYYSCYGSEKHIDYDSILANGGNFLSRLFGIRTKNMVLLLDEAHNMMIKDLEELPEYYNKEFFKSIIIVTSRPKFKFPEEVEELVSDDNRFELKMFSDKDAVKLVKNRLEDEEDFMPDKIIKEIHNKSSTPREFLMNCEDACRHAVERGSDIVEVEDI